MFNRLRSPKTVALVGGILAAVITSGCGGSGRPGAQIRGTVTLDGEPIPDGSIAFLPMDVVQAKSTTGQIAEGKYEVTQQSEVLGTHRVEIRAARPTGRMLPSFPPSKEPAEELEQYIPKIYNQNSTLTIDVQPGANEANFDLTSQGP